MDAIPRRHLPAEIRRQDVLKQVLEREAELSTNIGNGVAVPHARLPMLAAPLVAFGRSIEGVHFPGEPPEPVHLLFLLLTPADQPDLQLALLGQIARICSDPSRREALLHADSLADVSNHLVLCRRGDLEVSG